MYRDLVFRPNEDSYATRDLVFRPGIDKNFAEVLPYVPRTHTPLNPNSRNPYDIRPSDKYTMEIDLLEQARRRGPGSGGGIVADRPADYGIDEIPRTASVDAFGPDFMNKIEAADRAAKMFLDLFMLDRGLVAGYVPFKGVAPADIDPGGPESPEAMSQMADYLRRLRESGQIDRARQNLKKQGFPLGGV